MNKKDVLMIIVEIQTFYNYPFTKREPDKNANDVLLDLTNKWHKVLKDYEFETIKKNLNDYIKSNRFAPAIADLVNENQKERAIPNKEETQAMLRQWDLERVNESSKEKTDIYLANIRNLLGIKRSV
ncbi:MAG: replicative helicase loader/inhibitor [Thermotaleaceae bacterium]